MPTARTETVKSPGTLVISAYVTCPDITKTVTPDLKMPGRSKLLFIDLSAREEPSGRIGACPGVRPGRQ